MGRVDGLGRGRGTGGSDFGFGGSEVGAGICAGKGARPKFLALAHAFFFSPYRLEPSGFRAYKLDIF
jgi:hypothetical protein